MKKHISLNNIQRKAPPAPREELPLSVGALVNETDLGKYLEQLRRFSGKYVVAVASSDTPWGAKFPKELTAAMTRIGFKIDLFEKFRYTYAAAVDAGKLIFEEIGDTKTSIDRRIVLDGGDKMRLMSVSHSELNGDRAMICINDICCPLTERGLLFVVYDKHKKELIDAVWSDVCINPVCKHILKLYQTVKECVKAHPGVLPVGYVLPGFFKTPFTDYEKFVLDNHLHFSVIDANADKTISLLSGFYDEQGIHEVLATPRSYYDHRNVRQYEDHHGRFVNIEGGHRVTADVPQMTAPYLYIFGDCRVFGLGNSDERTIESYLQKRFNDERIRVIVENHGDFADGFFTHEDYINNLRRKLDTLPLKAGDMIFVQNPVGFSLKEDFPLLDMQYIFNEPHSEEYYFDVVHFAPGGNRKIADTIFDALIGGKIFDRALELAEEYKDAGAPAAAALGGGENAQLAEYKREITELYDTEICSSEKTLKIGAAVMNCNPFTLGHRRLIETAAKQCDKLIIFVVEEDKSVFPFADRLELVKAGTRDIPNVKVIPSGRFVLSSLTFSEYFNKSELQDRVIDTSLDVTVFAQEIAPCLHITKRFAGEEPFDAVTRQYNESMSRILPQYGIEFEEIPRMQTDGEPISASRVRRLLDEKRFDEIEKLVPETTLYYLREKFGQ